ncbi:grasp-with-spasm system SPASM domain peptide maturase [Flavobacterium sp.]|jgi:SPASM domain peptide maturase of grasp-with-spasm system|uniref:grasp-with-spasm system SPASM domain peptide maturase n=1 Tax=Flavobacterium sp. TaxID=239 RepID=UPI0037C1482C
MYPQKSFFKIFTNCLIVKGINRSLIIDMQRDSFTTIPDTLQEVIELFQSKKSIGDVYSFFGIENKEVIDEYLTFLIDSDYGFITNFDEFDLFVDMDFNFQIPAVVTNCIVEISSQNISKLDKLVSELEKLNCKNIQLIFYQDLDLEVFISILKLINRNNFQSIELVLKFSNVFLNFVHTISSYNNKISNVIFHSSGLNYKNEIVSNILVSYISNEIVNCDNCGIINKYYFNCNKNKVLESLNHNSCLNRKISIDKDGNIKNCPSMPQSFGNIKDTTLEEALNHPDFKKYWNITKDQIDVCKDCEFRHICTDCRAYVEEPNNQYSKPLKCGYNPYTNEWTEWSTNPLKQKAIEYYGMQDLVKKDA